MKATTLLPAGALALSLLFPPMPAAQAPYTQTPY